MKKKKTKKIYFKFKYSKEVQRTLEYLKLGQEYLPYKKKENTSFYKNQNKKNLCALPLKCKIFQQMNTEENNKTKQTNK